jgi:hypothetical protein
MNIAASWDLMPYSVIDGREVAHAVSRLLPTVVAQVRARIMWDL